jgi:hypothetical protein
LPNEDQNDDTISTATFKQDEDPNESEEKHGVKLVRCNIKNASKRIDLVNKLMKTHLNI